MAGRSRLVAAAISPASTSGAGASAAPARLGENSGCFIASSASSVRSAASSRSAVGDVGRLPTQGQAARVVPRPPAATGLKAGGSGSFSISSQRPNRVSA